MAVKTKSSFVKIKINRERHTVITPIARLSFPALFEPRVFEGSTEGKFMATFILEPQQVKEPYEGKKTQTVSIARAIANVKRDQWGEDKAKWPEFNQLTIWDGNDQVGEDGKTFDGYAGMVYIKGKTGEKYPPKVLDQYGQPLTDPDKIYGGCYVRGLLQARPYHTGQNIGVRFTLLQVMKVRDGERFGGFGSDVWDVENAELDAGDNAGGDNGGRW